MFLQQVERTIIHLTSYGVLCRQVGKNPVSSSGLLAMEGGRKTLAQERDESESHKSHKT